MTQTAEFRYDVVVVGGGSHVGLPLAVAFASRGLNTAIYDINQAAVDTILAGELPFLAERAQGATRRGAGGRAAHGDD